MVTIYSLKGGNAKQRRKVRRVEQQYGARVWTERRVRWHGDFHADGAYHVR